MEERFLFSDVYPLFSETGDEIIFDCFMEEIKKADKLEIAVGFASCRSLRILDWWVMNLGIKNISLILGMYCHDRFPEQLLLLVTEVNKKWQQLGIGEIRIVHSFRYHGKLYCFFKDNQIFSVIIGSPNLSFLVANEEISEQFKQYEIALFTNHIKTLKNAQKHINSLKSEKISKNISFFVQEQEKPIDETEQKQVKEKEVILKMKY